MVFVVFSQKVFIFIVLSTFLIEKRWFSQYCQQKVVFGRQNDSFLLRLSAKSWVWILKSKVLAETVSKKLHCENKNSSFKWDCRFKLAFQTWDLSLLLRVSPKTCFWEMSSLHLAETMNKKVFWEAEISSQESRSSSSLKWASLKGFAKENHANQLQPPNELFLMDV